MRGVIALLGLLATGLAQAQYPVITDIVFEGNDVTQPKVMLREMVVAPGDEADPEEIERSRQGVQDMGLFRSVSVRQEPAGDGVRLVFRVKEKWYILPLPRADASSDGGYAYGVQLRWDNMWGLDHSFTPYYERRQSSEGSADPEKRGVQERMRVAYYAPYAFDSPYGIGVAASSYRVPYVEPLEYEETRRSVGIGFSRRLDAGQGSQGWRGGLGISRSDHEITGFDAGVVRAEGRSLALNASLGHRDLRFNIYSDQGVDSSLSVSTAGRAYGSDYHETVWQAYHGWFLPVGSTPHQTVHFIGLAGARHGGATFAQEQFSLGGVQDLRGFEPETTEGDAFYLVSLEYLRPVVRNSVRVLAVIDAGNTFVQPADANLDKVLVSGGLGVRIRLQAFVNVDIELGIAWPLNGGQPRFFAGRGRGVR